MKHQATTTEFKAFVRNHYVFPGGYELHMIADDGGAVCHQCAKANAKQIIADTRCGMAAGWTFVGADVNWEDEDLYCAHCGDYIRAEYSNK